MDSGASVAAFPNGWRQHVKLWEAAGPRSGQSFNAADGEEIPNLGRRSVTLMTGEGAIRDMHFEVCNVTRALGSVSQMCRAGHKVAFNPPWDPTGSYIEHIDTGECMWLEEQNGIYMLNTKVAPSSKQKRGESNYTNNAGFGWHANP